MQVNTEEETAMEYAIYATVGLLSGLCFYYLARYQIQVRSIYDTENKGQRINNIGYRIAWMVVPAVLADSAIYAYHIDGNKCSRN